MAGNIPIAGVQMKIPNAQGGNNTIGGHKKKIYIYGSMGQEETFICADIYVLRIHN